MGAAGVLIGGAALGLGAASMMSKKPSYGTSLDAHSTMAAAHPVAPEAPAPTDTSSEGATSGNAQMEAERERERQAALLRRQQAQDVFTSGLGAAGIAQTAKKSLLGG